MADDFLDARMLAFYDELDREVERASDRGAAIIAASGLELMLDRILESSLVEGTFPNDSVSTFSAKIWLCHALGNLSDDERHDLTLIRKIRNTFAHDIDASLTTEPASDRCRALRLGERLYEPKSIPFLRDVNNNPYMVNSYPDGIEPPPVDVSMPDPTDTRQRLVVTTRALMKVLGSRWMDLAAPRPNTPREFEVDEPSRLFVESLESLVHGDKRQSNLERMDELRPTIMALPEEHVNRVGFEALEKELSADSEMYEFLSTAAKLARYGYETVRETRRRQRQKPD